MSNYGNRELLETTSWQRTSLGPRAQWPSDMQAVVRNVMASGFPIWTAWGKDGIQIYNDGYNAIFGDKHPGSFGAAAKESWSEIWEFLEPALNEVRRKREQLWFKDTLLPLVKKREPEECYFDFSYSPILDSRDRVLGVMSVATEKTADAVFRRRQTIADLSLDLAEEEDFSSLSARLFKLLSENETDCAAAVLFSTDRYTDAPTGQVWTLRCSEDFARAVRPAVATAVRASSVQTLPLAQIERPASWASRGNVIALRGHGLATRGLLLVVPNRLVPVTRSHKGFVGEIGARFNSLLQDAESRLVRLGQLQQQQAEQQTLYRFLFENMKEAAFYCSTKCSADEDEIVLEANPQACALLGYSHDEIIGMSRDSFYAPDSPELAAALERRARDGVFVGRLHIKGKNGRDVPVEMTSNLVTLPSGEVRSLTIARDISEQLAVEGERMERVRLESVAGLTGGLAHDFNNLLTVILSSSDLLVRQLPQQESQGLLSQNIKLAAERASELTNQLLSYSRRQTLSIRPLDVAAFLKEIHPLLRTALGELCRLELRLDEACPPCLADPSQLTTALLNLAVNARDAMPDGGTILLHCSLADVDTLPAAEDAHRISPGSYVVLCVEDSGTGLQPAVRKRIFEPFFTTKEVGSGSGLGLSMVQGYIRQSGGDIRVESSPGRGTRMHLLLPAADRATAPRTQTQGQGKARGQIILYVEDNELVRRQTTVMLREMGLTPLLASNAREALAKLDEAQSVHLVLTDLVMPGGMSGSQLAAELRRRRPDVPIVITTGHDQHRDSASFSADGIDIIRKPYTQDDLEETLMRQLGEAEEG